VLLEKLRLKKMKYVILLICLASSLAKEFDRPCRDDVPAKENFSTLFVSAF
jgi:hypothetical protein